MLPIETGVAGAVILHYSFNPYIPLKNPVWAMGEWIENALRGIAQRRGTAVYVPEKILDKIVSLSFLDLLSCNLTQEELDWCCGIYNAFDEAAAQIDYKKLK